MQREIAPASSRSVEASIKDKPSEKDLRFFNFGPSSNHWSVTGAGLKAREINSVSYTHLTLPTNREV